MAAHYVEPGHTPVVVGGDYTRFRSYTSRIFWCRLRSQNEVTGTCVLVSEGGHVFFVSASELSQWRLVRRPGDAT